jgi:hypothetical protein
MICRKEIKKLYGTEDNAGEIANEIVQEEQAKQTSEPAKVLGEDTSTESDEEDSEELDGDSETETATIEEAGGRRLRSRSKGKA